MNIAAVKIAQKRAGLPDPEYRALLRRVAGVTSSKELDEARYKRVLAELYRIADQNAAAATSRDKKPVERKIWALWYELRGHLPAPERSVDYLLGFIRRAAHRDDLRKPDDLALLTNAEAHRAIEALNHRVNQEQSALAADVPF